MRVAQVDSRAVLIKEDQYLDIEKTSQGRFRSDLGRIYDKWIELRDWAEGLKWSNAVSLGSGVAFSSPAPHPGQVFAIGLNYRDHAHEMGMELPEIPTTFTKFPSCLTGDRAHVKLPSSNVDWEVELVVVMGIKCHEISCDKAWDYVAGLSIGQDLSERVVQVKAGGQFSLGKSFPGFGPIGPCLVTPDELADPNDLALKTKINGEIVQDSRTSQMIFSVAEIISRLSEVVTLNPGDVIFTGTPSGVGMSYNPPRFLSQGDVITSEIEGIGVLTTFCV
ncbi:MAG: fumarylacetoacetate hydrolase family protein [Acidimicrobiales bacterium]|nr:fumarylacetoacetate hydrolase family protein [Acidimicrobiales bacterium]